MVRSLLALVLGYVVMLALQLGGDTALTAMAPDIMPLPGEPVDPAYFAYRLGSGFFFIALGGYVTALLAGRSEMKHALGLAALSITASILEVQYYPTTQPLWYSIALMFLSIPSALAGGYYRVRQLEEHKSRAASAE
jgi:peptidoglycan/LPS O-acetylase OafA/YrhL